MFSQVVRKFNSSKTYCWCIGYTRLVEKIVWVRWSLKISLSITFQANQQFHFPFSLNTWKLTSTCQNREISISITYWNCSADLVSCNLNKFVGNANVQGIRSLRKRVTSQTVSSQTSSVDSQTHPSRFANVNALFGVHEKANQV